MTLGSASPSWFPAWLRSVVYQLVAGGPPAAPPVAFDGIARRTAGLDPIEDMFALYVGPQHLQAWTGADVCVLVPSFGEPSALMALATDVDRQVLGATSMGLDVHVWGREPVPAVTPIDSIFWDIERYTAAGEIYQNVYRAIYYASYREGISWGTVDGWQNETEIQRYGEAFIFRVAVSFPIYDFAPIPIPLPQVLDPRVSIKAPGE